MSFRDLDLKFSYNSENDDLLNDFYIPVLKEAVDYKRITGYFSSSSFFTAAPGIAQIVRNNGRMQFILNVVLSDKDYEQIERGIREPEKIIEQGLYNDLMSLEDEVKKDYTALLGWLIANEYLEVRIGFIRDKSGGREILHQKIGILTDEEGNQISFSGSNNESAYGWLYNSEKFKVFFGWIENQLSYVKDDLNDFNILWNNLSKKTEVIPFPEAIKQNLMEISHHESFDLDEVLVRMSGYTVDTKPQCSISFRQYQKDAIRLWFDNRCRGIFEMATGTGKTYTALGALKQLLESKSKLITIISVPFLHLSRQWEKALNEIKIQIPIIYADSTNSHWTTELQKFLLENSLGRRDQFIVLTTHDSLSNEKFISLIQGEDIQSPILLIGDEVHGLGATKRLEGLLEEYEFRLGLSATPKRYFDELGTEELLEYFGDVIYSFDINRAINETNPDTGETYLTPYNYHPIFIQLTEEDRDKYFKLSLKISRLCHKKDKTKSEKELLEKQLRDRQDILKNSTTKYPAFETLIRELAAKNEMNHTLIYCSPQQMETTQNIVRKVGGITQHRFTSKEDAYQKKDIYGGFTEREYLINNFTEGIYHVLVSMRCLDEGIDIPAAKNAILLCSSGNPREYIQRRGRILRRHPGKNIATIYDFVVIPSTIEGDIDKKIINSQLNRVNEFAKDAANRIEVEEKIFRIREKYRVY